MKDFPKILGEEPGLNSELGIFKAARHALVKVL